MFSGFNGILWFMGLGTLAAGIVGVSNIMIITVKERTKEIGVRKALGARPASIVRSLMVESILVTSIAGYTGLVLGVALLEVVSYSLEALDIQLSFFQQPEVDFALALTALALLVRSEERKSTRLNSSHVAISYAVFCLKKKKSARGGAAELQL